MISWAIFYFIPVILLGCNVIGEGNIIYVALTVLFVYTFYEVGYIFNDAILIKKEINPTLRLTNAELKYAYNNFPMIMLVRAVWAISILLVFYFSGFHYVLAAAGGIGILLIYYIYNKTRSNLSAVLYYSLIIFRFCVPFIILYQGFPVWILVMQPLLATLEYTGKKKLFNGMFEWFITYKEYTRFIWYFVMTCLIYVSPFPSGSYFPSSLIFVAMIGLMFRSLILIKKIAARK
ncbi:hypothetical protein MOW87_001488 [Citrobacter freundii]|nr:MULTISPECIES: hypothetical protein [Citrobacter]EIX7372139.1 hypothetical protein [Citrobacter freundii]EKU2551338.1 hypothetical protein [Citrobacter freundii]MBJ9855502.1 hypothetical protein [Citrobacter freundii]MDM3241823.1 hypothetical protein [Citrobacter sp. Cf081]WLV36135.1 hypothetical protein M2O47_08680 [Citrobacter freundii]